jgi:hypothetical protein
MLSISYRARIKEQLMIRTSRIALALVSAVLVAPANGEVLYDFTETIDSGGLSGTNEMGQSIRIAHESSISQFTFSAGSGPPFAFTDDIRVRLYRTTGLSGAPTNLLWSGQLDDITLSRSISTYTIDVPNVVVPRLFAFSVELVGKQHPMILHPGTSSSPLGQFGQRFYWYQGSWDVLYDRDPGPFAIKVIGVSTGVIPEPNSIALVLTASIGIGWVVSRLRPSAARPGFEPGTPR